MNRPMLQTYISYITISVTVYSVLIKVFQHWLLLCIDIVTTAPMILQVMGELQRGCAPHLHLLVLLTPLLY